MKSLFLMLEDIKNKVTDDLDYDKLISLIEVYQKTHKIDYTVYKMLLDYVDAAYKKSLKDKKEDDK